MIYKKVKIYNNKKYFQKYKKRKNRISKRRYLKNKRKLKSLKNKLQYKINDNLLSNRNRSQIPKIVKKMNKNQKVTKKNEEEENQ
jgi:hypothetical protein